MQFWPPDDEYMCSKHVEARNKLTVKQKFCASSRLITEINDWFSITETESVYCAVRSECFNVIQDNLSLKAVNWCSCSAVCWQQEVTAIPLGFLLFLVPNASLLIYMSRLLFHVWMLRASNDEAVIEATNGHKCLCGMVARMLPYLAATVSFDTRVCT